MTETPAQRRYRDDARLLAGIGEQVAAQTGPVTVRLPQEVAEAAVRAWQRDETDPPGPESGEQAYVRAFAASLALIGLAIDEADGDVVVTLDPARAAAAVFAHECATDGLLDRS
ncbi:hypothetical protein [Actinoplanes utahensis]|uniref:Uncharacterized protein n=1 Tax=Actinoplanes utahensis TaxID=1869 RepID=A0A0A6UQ11_ACTUT|nr:hypothetical protein [Actinoplanes utahensis]KHD77531.1 hypothetical protein MB27_10560 [Actinoplanes utahensis]GIF32699.1 hypothetical protein Aut01nite_56850 [Actinoplanes utahensis]